MHTNPEEKLRSTCIALPDVLPRWRKGMRAHSRPSFEARSQLHLGTACGEMPGAFSSAKSARTSQSNVLPCSNTPLAHKIAEGASEFFVEVLREPGQHVRSAMTAADPPLGRCLEIELFAEVFEPGAA